MIIATEPEDLRNIRSGTEWQELKFVVGKGASETVDRDGMLEYLSVNVLLAAAEEYMTKLPN